MTGCHWTEVRNFWDTTWVRYRILFPPVSINTRLAKNRHSGETGCVVFFI
jgi:hypothetical protein